MALDLTKKVAVAKVVLEKKNVFGQKAQIVIATDISGSMSRRFEQGKVQELITRMLGIGMNMDVNNAIDVFAFNNRSHVIGEATQYNIDGFVDNVFLRKVSVNGGTSYSPVMSDIVGKFGNVVQPQSGFGKLFGKKSEPVIANVPTLVFFITDGELGRSDKEATEKIIRDSSNQAIFWQFIGIGSEEFDFLQKLDDLSGRFLDNADFFKVEDPTTTPDEWFYEQILNEFPSWLNQAKSKGILL
jgi:hypothetical protein